MQVKNNQPTLHDEIEKIATDAPPDETNQSKDKGRNRSETRTVSVFRPAEGAIGAEWKPHVKTVIRVERETFTRNTKTGLLHRSSEIALYIANDVIGAQAAATAIRAHWKIETTSHYSRDVTLGEDRSRIRTKTRLFARIRSFAFNILKANKVDNLSQDRYRAALIGIHELIKIATKP